MSSAAILTNDVIRSDAVPTTDGMNLQSLQREALAATLDNFALGVIILSDEKRILYANRAAVRMLAAGRPVRSVNGCLSTRDPAAIEQLSRAVAIALRPGSQIGASGIAVALGSHFGQPAIAHVVPLAYGDADPALMPATAAVFIAPALVPPSADLSGVVRCLGLTSSEGRLLEKLAAGATVAEAAVALGIADTTAKTHLTHIFSKAGVARQVELVAHPSIAPTRARSSLLSAAAEGTRGTYPRAARAGAPGRNRYESSASAPAS